MKFKFFILICLFGVLSTAYSQKALLLHPLFIEQDAVLISEMMLITYDINNSNFSEITSNPKIYTPKVITVQLKWNGKRISSSNLKNARIFHFPLS